MKERRLISSKIPEIEGSELVASRFAVWHFLRNQLHQLVENLNLVLRTTSDTEVFEIDE